MRNKSKKRHASAVAAPEELAAPLATKSFNKEYSEDGSACVVTFWLARDAAPDASYVALAGTFNQWDQHSHLMDRLGSGDFALMVVLESGREYEFRYLIDGKRWENAWSADKYVWSDYAGCENSVVVT